MSANAYAFFDVDETLITIKSMFDFFPFWAHTLEEPQRLARFKEAFKIAYSRGDSREDLNRLYYQFFAGDSITSLAQVGHDWYRDRFVRRPTPLIRSTTERLAAHRHAGIEPVFVSGSMSALLKPIAMHLRVQHVLCTKQFSDASGQLTGEIARPQSIGIGKAELVTKFMARMHVDPMHCFAYGDDISDVPMLETVGTPVVVGEKPDLLAIGQERQWDRLRIDF